MLAIDFHGLEHLWQTGRGHDGVRRDLFAGEDLAAARAYIGGADKELGHHGSVFRMHQGVEVHHTGQQLAQRIDIERIGLVGRQELVEYAHDGHARQRHAPQNIAHGSHGSHTLPELAQRLAGQIPPQMQGICRFSPARLPGQSHAPAPRRSWLRRWCR